MGCLCKEIGTGVRRGFIWANDAAVAVLMKKEAKEKRWIVPSWAGESYWASHLDLH